MNMQNEYETEYTLMRNLIMILLLLGSYLVARTTTVRLFVNSEQLNTIVVSITETHMVKVTIKNNETGEVIEGQVSTEEQTEEEPDCE